MTTVKLLRRRCYGVLAVVALVPAGASAQPGVSAAAQAVALEKVLVGEDTAMPTSFARRWQAALSGGLAFARSDGSSSPI